MDNSTLTVAILLGLVALRGVLIGIGAALILRPVADCPACAGETFALHRPWLRLLLRWVEWRWCPACGWSGPGRRLPADRGGPAVARSRHTVS